MTAHHVVWRGVGLYVLHAQGGSKFTGSLDVPKSEETFGSCRIEAVEEAIFSED